MEAKLPLAVVTDLQMPGMQPVKALYRQYPTVRVIMVTAYGSEDMNELIDMAAEFGCPLYDSQTGERFDGG